MHFERPEVYMEWNGTNLIQAVKNLKFKLYTGWSEDSGQQSNNLLFKSNNVILTEITIILSFLF